MQRPDDSAPPAPSDGFFERVFGLGVFALLLWGSLRIMRPFAPAIVWGIMISVSIWPLHARLTRALRGRVKLSAILLSLVLATLLIGPVAGLLAALSDASQLVLAKVQAESAGQLAPPPFLAKIPWVGDALHRAWADAAGNLEGTYAKFKPSLGAAIKWAFASTLDLGLALLQFLLAIGISAPMLIGGPIGARTLTSLADRLAPERGATLVDLAARCIRSISFGVIGTALLQGLLMAVGLALAGVPGIAVLGFVSFMLAVLQIGLFPVWIPAALWLASVDHAGWAIFLTVWGLAAGVVDNLLKPYLISHGTGLPLTLIFLGVLGGMIAWGFVGIFVGPTVLAVTYTLLRSWVTTPGSPRSTAREG